MEKMRADVDLQNPHELRNEPLGLVTKWGKGNDDQLIDG